MDPAQDLPRFDVLALVVPKPGQGQSALKSIALAPWSRAIAIAFWKHASASLAADDKTGRVHRQPKGMKEGLRFGQRWNVKGEVINRVDSRARRPQCGMGHESLLTASHRMHSPRPAP